MPTETVSETRLAYFAGFFDGEGWIGIIKRKKTYFSLEVGAGQCDPRPIQMLHAAFGGSITIVRQRHNSLGKHVFYSWRIASVKAERFLRAIQPYLIHKREQCDVALSFRQFVSTRKRYGSYKAPAEYRALEIEYSDLIRRVRSDTREKIQCP